MTIDERKVMHAEQKNYSLWVATVAKPSGAYLVDVDLQVTDLKSRNLVVDRRLEGPWYMVSLPPGSYQVKGTFRAEGAGGEQTLEQTVTVAPGVVRQAVLRFDSNATLSPEMKGPFDGNPFGAAPKGN